MTVTRDGETLTPATSTVPDTEAGETFDFYIVNPGDVITVSAAGETKGGVKAGPDVRGKVIDDAGTVTTPATSSFNNLPVTYTVTENDVYIVVENIRS